MSTPTAHNTRAEVEGLPELFKDKGFSNFNRDKNPVNYDKCIAYYKENSGKSLVFCGKVGNGKTHLAVAVLKNIKPIERIMYVGTSATGEKITNKQFTPARCQFLVFDEFLMELNDAAMQKRSKMDVISGYLDNNDVICLDDLGEKNLTPAKMENLYLFVNRAYLNKKRIIITTNLTPDGLNRIDERIKSRLDEMAEYIVFAGADYRGKKAAK